MFFNNLTMGNVILNNDIQLYNFLELKGYAMGICIMNNCKKTIYRYAKLITKFAIYYPQYMKGDDNKKVKMRRKFRKLAFKFIINSDNRLCIKNPLKKL